MFFVKHADLLSTNKNKTTKIKQGVIIKDGNVVPVFSWKPWTFCQPRSLKFSCLLVLLCQNVPKKLLWNLRNFMIFKKTSRIIKSLTSRIQQPHDPNICMYILCWFINHQIETTSYKNRKHIIFQIWCKPIKPRKTTKLEKNHQNFSHPKSHETTSNRALTPW